jgi:hypothetical protein
MRTLLSSHSDAWWTIVGVGAVFLGVIITLLLMRWESYHATNAYKKRKNRNDKLSL